MMKTKIAVALLATISVNCIAATWIRCEQCQAQDAYAYAHQSGLSDEVVVISLANQMTAKFFNKSRLVGKNCIEQRMDSGHVAHNTESDSGCSYELMTMPMALAPKEGGLKAALQQFYTETNGTMKSVLHVNATDLTMNSGPISGTAGGSAYDFVNNAIFSGLIRTRAYAAINDPTISGTWGNLARAIVGAGSVLALGGGWHQNNGRYYLSRSVYNEFGIYRTYDAGFGNFFYCRKHADSGCKQSPQIFRATYLQFARQSE